MREASPPSDETDVDTGSRRWIDLSAAFPPVESPRSKRACYQAPPDLRFRKPVAYYAFLSSAALRSDSADLDEVVTLPTALIPAEGERLMRYEGETQGWREVPTVRQNGLVRAACRYGRYALFAPEGSDSGVIADPSVKPEALLQRPLIWWNAPAWRGSAAGKRAEVEVRLAQSVSFDTTISAADAERRLATGAHDVIVIVGSGEALPDQVLADFVSRGGTISGEYIFPIERVAADALANYLRRIMTGRQQE
jgi:hypothetical protein